jgi:hypothetical protein
MFKNRILTYLFFKLKGDGPSLTKNVVIDICSMLPNRRLYQIVSQFLYSGYICFINLNFKQFFNMDLYGRRATKLKNVFPAKKNKKYTLAISDNTDSIYFNNAKNILLNFNVFGDITISHNDMFYPILFHPNFLSSYWENSVLRDVFHTKRKIGALFIGNVDSDYNNPFTKKIFRINTREETFVFIRNSLPQSYVYIPKNLDEFLYKIETEELLKKIVLLNACDFSIPNNLWFKILLTSNFFIHMSGYIQPFCHNQIESMLAGCIPITQFCHFFIPNLTNQKNALTFTSLEELTNILTNIINGKYNTIIASMRKDIVHYYKKNFSFQSFKDKLETIKNSANYYIATGDETILHKLAQDIINPRKI